MRPFDQQYNLDPSSLFFCYAFSILLSHVVSQGCYHKKARKLEALRAYKNSGVSG
jgi:hypothetical protein